MTASKSTTNARELLATIVQGVRADIAHCGALVPLLSEQQRLLARHDSEGLQKLAGKLDPHLKALEASAAVRAGAFHRLGLAPSAEGVAALLARLPAPLARSMEDLWRQLEQGLAQCHTLNERNGELLAHQRLALAEITGAPLNPYEASR